MSSDLDQIIHQSAIYVVASDRLRSRTIDAVRRRQIKRRRRHTIVLASAACLGIAWMPSQFASKAKSSIPQVWFASFVTPTTDLHNEAIDQIGNQGSDLDWALYELVARQRGSSQR